MKKYFVILLLVGGFLSVKAQDLTLSYEVLPTVEGTEQVSIYMTNLTADPMEIGSINLSLMYNQNCASVKSVWSVFEDNWGTGLSMTLESDIDRTYEGIMYNRRFQYGNTFPNATAPVSIELVNPQEKVLAMTIEFQASCPLQVRMESQAQNPLNEVGSIVTELIPYTIDQITTTEIELIDFQAFQSDLNAVQLEWVTAKELGSAEFVVESSKDASRFQKVATIEAAGTSQAPLSYQLEDASVKAAVVYYRLRMVDVAGNETFSEVRKVQMSETFDHLLTLYPNPAQAELTIESSQLSDQTYRLSVYDMNGSVLMSDSQVELGAQSIQLNVSDLPQGTYLLELTDAMGQHLSRRFVKQ